MASQTYRQVGRLELAVAGTETEWKKQKLHHKSNLYSLSYISRSFVLIFSIYVPVFIIPMGDVGFFFSLLYSFITSYLDFFFLSFFFPPTSRVGGMMDEWIVGNCK